jgi:hypothetical protein
MEEARRLGPPEETAQPDLRRRRLEEILAADDEVDPVTKVVDDHAQPVCPVFVAISDWQVAGERDRT